MLQSYDMEEGIAHTKYWRTTQARARMVKRVRPVLNGATVPCMRVPVMLGPS